MRIGIIWIVLDFQVLRLQLQQHLVTWIHQSFFRGNISKLYGLETTFIKSYPWVTWGFQPIFVKMTPLEIILRACVSAISDNFRLIWTNVRYYWKLSKFKKPFAIWWLDHHLPYSFCSVQIVNNRTLISQYCIWSVLYWNRKFYPSREHIANIADSSMSSSKKGLFISETTMQHLWNIVDSDANINDHLCF